MVFFPLKRFLSHYLLLLLPVLLLCPLNPSPTFSDGACSLGLTVYEVSTRMELPGDGEYWHAMRDGTAVGLPSSRSQELGTVLRQVSVVVLGNPQGRQRCFFV